MFDDIIFACAFGASWVLVLGVLFNAATKAVSEESYRAVRIPQHAPPRVSARRLCEHVLVALARDPEMRLSTAFRRSIIALKPERAARSYCALALGTVCVRPLLAAGAREPWTLRPEARLYLFDRICGHVTPQTVAETAYRCAERGGRSGSGRSAERGSGSDQRRAA